MTRDTSTPRTMSPTLAPCPAPEAPAAAGPGCREERRITVGIVLPCYNEAENIPELHRRLAAVCDSLPRFEFRFLFIDNASTDDSVAVLRGLMAHDSRIRAIVNARNFGHIRSPFHGILQAEGDCVIQMCTDLQDPPELIPLFLEAWERGASIAVGQKKTSRESRAFWILRSIYYKIARAIAEVDLLEHVTGFGLYDRRAIEIMRGYNDPYPYLRGMVVDIGLPYTVIPYDQPLRTRGITKNDFLTLFDMAMLGFTSHSRLPLRAATLLGFSMSALSLVIALGFLVLKCLLWDAFPAGYAPAVIGIFFVGSLQIFLVGLLGEYVGAILTHVRQRPLVVERERLGTGVAEADRNQAAARAA